MTPYEAVREQFKFPFELRPIQIDGVNYLSQWDRVGFYWEPGVGKTAGSTHQAVYLGLTAGYRQWIVLVPPILLAQWEKWLRSITDLRTGQPLSTTIYAGTPKQRQKLTLDSEFIITTYGLLKNDFDRFYTHFEDKKLGVLADEATAVKNIESDTHKAVRMMAEGRPLLLLTGTPINKPLDAYAYIKLIAPGIYRNLRQFERLHVAEKDEYDNVVEWANMDLLASNMRVQTSRILLRDARADMPEPLFTQITYKLDPEHLKLYRRIAEERLVEFSDGSEIDAISASALRSALQQVVVNWGEFDENPERRPAVLDLIDEVMEEIGDRKLVVAAHFRRTNAYLLKELSKYNAVAVYGDVAKAERSRAIQRFIDDPKCRLILLQPSSAGFGVDGLQHVCSDMLIVEAPTTPAPFNQVVARLDRDGQTHPVHCRIAIAQSTVQVGMFGSLLNNDALANSVQRSYQDLRDAVYGNK